MRAPLHEFTNWLTCPFTWSLLVLASQVGSKGGPRDPEGLVPGFTPHQRGECWEETKAGGRAGEGGGRGGHGQASDFPLNAKANRSERAGHQPIRLENPWEETESHWPPNRNYSSLRIDGQPLPLSCER